MKKVFFTALVCFGVSLNGHAQLGNLMKKVSDKVSGGKSSADPAAPVDPNDTKVCLPAAGMKDEELEAKMLEVFNAKHWPEKPTAVRIKSTSWGIVRNEYTGIITRRTIVGIVASTRKNGKCQYQSFLFGQDHDGTEYQDNLYMVGVGEQQDMPCGCVVQDGGKE